MSEYLRSAIQCDYSVVGYVTPSIGGAALQTHDDLRRVELELKRTEDLLHQVDTPGDITTTSWPVGHSNAWDIAAVPTMPGPDRCASARWAEMSERIAAARRRQQQTLDAMVAADREAQAHQVMAAQSATLDATQDNNNTVSQQPQLLGSRPQSSASNYSRIDADFIGPSYDLPRSRVHPIDVLHSKVQQDLVDDAIDMENKYQLRQQLNSAQRQRTHLNM